MGFFDTQRGHLARSSLPTLPLWIAVDVPIPIDLEQSYLATCEALRIRVR